MKINNLKSFATVELMAIVPIYTLLIGLMIYISTVAIAKINLEIDNYNLSLIIVRSNGDNDDDIPNVPDEKTCLELANKFKQVNYDSIECIIAENILTLTTKKKFKSEIPFINSLAPTLSATTSLYNT